MFTPQSDEGFGSICALGGTQPVEMKSGVRLCGYEKAQAPFTHPRVSPFKVQQNNTIKLDFGWINRCVRRFPCCESHTQASTVDNGTYGTCGPPWTTGADYTGLLYFPRP